jgi:hypothetical protein
MCGDADAISHIAQMAGKGQVSEKYRAKVEHLCALIDQRLWNPDDKFYETVPRNAPSGWSDVRELAGYIPWYFDIPSAKYDAAWTFLFDPKGFAGRYGPTTAERRSPRFNYAVHHADIGGPGKSAERAGTVRNKLVRLRSPACHLCARATYSIASWKMDPLN